MMCVCVGGGVINWLLRGTGGSRGGLAEIAFSSVRHLLAAVRDGPLLKSIKGVFNLNE